MSLSRVLLAAGAVVLLAGCTPDHEYDQAAHEAALEEAGVEVTGDMDTITDAFTSACESDDPGTWTAGFLRDGGDADTLLVSVDHLCPDRAEEFADAVEGLVE
ncbi:hypothetical protein [Nocardiopsis ganjiahuensis]|uniref:hypothetical protein n=1 Tax=Nocardiopsis ganjiahuensis TaxID=239984 RepID=UPI00034AEB46|nr:hypothetical protein [Nocardiopsis ganjiahuensis]